MSEFRPPTVCHSTLPIAFSAKAIFTTCEHAIAAGIVVYVLWCTELVSTEGTSDAAEFVDMITRSVGTPVSADAPATAVAVTDGLIIGDEFGSLHRDGYGVDLPLTFTLCCMLSFQI